MSNRSTVNNWHLAKIAKISYFISTLTVLNWHKPL